jgi:hypothetical protein
MAAAAVSDDSTTGAAEAAPKQRKTLSLPAGAVRRQRQAPAEVVIFEEASAALPKPHVTSDAEAEEARAGRAHVQERERLSRERGAKILRQWRSGDAGAAGEAMLARPHKDVPIAFLDPDVLEAALTRQFGDAHLIDRMWDQGQLNDWQYATANRLLQLAEAAGMINSKVAGLGRSGAGHAEMSDGMAAAHARLNKLLSEVGTFSAEMLLDLCLESYSARGQANRAEAMKDGLQHLARVWGIQIC